MRHERRPGDRGQAPARARAARTYYFCSAGCAAEVRGGARRRTSGRAAAGRSRRRADAIYTCPMHPEIEQVGPGRLPDLRHGARAQDGHASRTGRAPSYLDMTPAVLGQRRAGAAAAGLGDGRPSARARLDALSRRSSRTGSSSRSRRRSCSGPAGRSSSAAGRRSRNRSLNMFTLIGIGVGAAYVYSVVATLAPGHLPGRVPRPRGRGRRSTSRPRR